LAWSSPELEARLNGFAVRVPIPTGSLVDLTVSLSAGRDRVRCGSGVIDSGAR
jgi:glyceraldehyde-3-phosphate dehydrogenase/erythrose-4-phosphate dehydrogenase